MEPMRSAVNHGVRFGVHSDDPITEVNPLFPPVRCNRKSGISGKVYGEDQCLTADEAMRCITLNAAWLLHLKTGSVRSRPENGQTSPSWPKKLLKPIRLR